MRKLAVLKLLSVYAKTEQTRYLEDNGNQVSLLEMGEIHMEGGGKTRMISVVLGWNWRYDHVLRA